MIVILVHGRTPIVPSLGLAFLPSSPYSPTHPTSLAPLYLSRRFPPLIAPTRYRCSPHHLRHRSPPSSSRSSFSRRGSRPFVLHPLSSSSPPIALATCPLASHLVRPVLVAVVVAAVVLVLGTHTVVGGVVPRALLSSRSSFVVMGALIIVALVIIGHARSRHALLHRRSRQRPPGQTLASSSCILHRNRRRRRAR